MRGFLGALVICAMAAAPAAVAAESVRFPVTDFRGQTITLTGKLTRPAGPGPFPAIVVLHGCEGAGGEDSWVEPLLVSWGYVVLQVDSYGPRGRASTCGAAALDLGANVRALDAHAAKDFLAGQSYVVAEKIAVWGWSDGATTILTAVSNPSFSEPWRPHPFSAGVAFYPRCPLKLTNLASPVLILIGSADAWNNAAYCRAMTLKGANAFEVDLVIYPDATHAFNWQRPPKAYGDRGVRYDPAAARKAHDRAKAFLESHQRPPGS